MTSADAEALMQVRLHVGRAMVWFAALFQPSSLRTCLPPFAHVSQPCCNPTTLCSPVHCRRRSLLRPLASRPPTPWASPGQLGRSTCAARPACCKTCPTTAAGWACRCDSQPGASSSKSTCDDAAGLRPLGFALVLFPVHDTQHALAALHVCRCMPLFRYVLLVATLMDCAAAQQ